MNFLLHLRLTELAGLPAAGAIIGDVLRGRLDPGLPSPLARSIALHRRVDALSDRHPLLNAIKRDFPVDARRYAGIVLDLVCDHVAANDWSRYGPALEPLEDSTRRMAQAVADVQAWRVSVNRSAPGEARFAALLLGYRDRRGIDRAIERIAERLRKPEPFRSAAVVWPSTIEATRAVLPAVFEDLAEAASGFALD